MNIFDIYLDKIVRIVIDQNKKGLIKIPETLNSINVDIPPKQFDCDISTNVSMVLAKINNTQPIELANKLITLIKKEDSYDKAGNLLKKKIFEQVLVQVQKKLDAKNLTDASNSDILKEVQREVINDKFELF